MDSSLYVNTLTGKHIPLVQVLLAIKTNFTSASFLFYFIAIFILYGLLILTLGFIPTEEAIYSYRVTNSQKRYNFRNYRDLNNLQFLQISILFTFYHFYIIRRAIRLHIQGNKGYRGLYSQYEGQNLFSNFSNYFSSAFGFQSTPTRV